MKTKRKIALILALCLAVGLLAGCGAQTGGASDAAPTQTPAPTGETGAKAPEENKDAQPASNAVAELFDASITPQDTAQVMYLTGSWHDMGVQYGQQAEYALLRQYVQSASEMIANCGGDIDEVYGAINTYMEQVRSECPDLYDFVVGVDEALDSLDFVQSAIASVCSLAYVNGAASSELNCMNATAWGSATESGHLLAATNGDTGLGDSFQFAGTMILMPEDGYVTLCSSGAGSNAYMNDQGVITLGSGGQGALDTDGFTTLISCWAQVYITTKSATADEVLEWDQRSDMFHAWLGNTHIADTSGKAYVFENTAGHSAVRASGDFGETDYLIANNHFLTDEMQSSLLNDGSYDDCPVRYATVEQVFKENFGKLDIGLMHEAIASRRYYLDGQWSGENWSQDLDTFYSSDSSNTHYKTTIRTLIDADELTFYRQLGSSDYFNNHNPDATTRFFKLILAPSVFEMNMNADMDASWLIYLAGQELDGAAAPDSAMVDNLNSAKQYYNEGLSYTNQAGYYEALGDTASANYMYGRATDAFCRAQQYAQNAMSDANSFTAVDGPSYTR